MDYRDPEWVAERLGVEKNTVYKFLQDGTIPAVQLGRKWLISESQLEQWLKDETDRQTKGRREASAAAERTVRRMDNFTPEARAAIKTAHAEARRYGHTYLGQEHLLLGFGIDGECAAGRMLRALGVGLEQIRQVVEARVKPGEGTPPRRLGRTARCKQAMKLAMKEAKRRGEALVSSEMLLMGILLCGEGVGWEILKEMGVGEEQVKRGACGVVRDEAGAAKKENGHDV